MKRAAKLKELNLTKTRKHSIITIYEFLNELANKIAGLGTLIKLLSIGWYMICKRSNTVTRFKAKKKSRGSG